MGGDGGGGDGECNSKCDRNDFSFDMHMPAHTHGVCNACIGMCTDGIKVGRASMKGLCQRRQRRDVNGRHGDDDENILILSAGM